MLELSSTAGSTSAASHSLAHQMLLAATCLSAANKSLFEQLFIKGAPESDVAQALQLTPQELKLRKTNLLRTLMSATSAKTSK